MILLDLSPDMIFFISILAIREFQSMGKIWTVPWTPLKRSLARLLLFFVIFDVNFGVNWNVICPEKRLKLGKQRMDRGWKEAKVTAISFATKESQFLPISSGFTSGIFRFHHSHFYRIQLTTTINTATRIAGLWRSLDLAGLPPGWLSLLPSTRSGIFITTNLPFDATRCHSTIFITSTTTT